MSKNNNTAGPTLASEPAAMSNDTRKYNEIQLSSTKTEHKPGVFTYDYVMGDHFWNRLHYLTRQKAYSNSIFKDGHRHSDNVIGFGNVIIYDIDDGYTLREVKDIIEPYKFLMVTTSSHQKDKKGITCDRFRVLLWAEDKIDMTNEEHKRFMALLAEQIGLDPEKLDTGCFNITAAYKPASNQLHYYNEGIKIPVEKMQSLAKELIKAEQTIEEYKPVKEFDYETDKTKILEALHRIDPDCPYDEWFKVGAALKTEFGEDGFAHFDEWSSRGSGYNERSIQHKWRQFTADVVGAGTIIRMAS